MAADPLDPQLLRKQNRQQLLSDVLRNARGMGEAALTMGTGLADMAGTGLGTLAGMGVSKLRGDAPNLDAAAEGMQAGKFTYQPRTEGGQEALRGIETVTAPLEKGMQWAGQKTADVTGSPAAGAAVYTALNVLDPELLAPTAAKVAALRGASNVARSTQTAPVPRKGAIGTNQTGAWSPGDIADEGGDFSMRSTVEEALLKLKPQEQKARGKQMRKVLEKYGAKKGELEWTGLDTLLDQDMPVTANDIADHMTRYGVRVEQERFGTSGPEVAKGADELDEDAINEKAYDLAHEDSDLEYPVQYHVRNTDYGNDVIESFGSEREAERFVEQYRQDLAENEFEYYRNERGPEDNEDWDDWSDEQKDEWASENARQAAEDASLEIESETDYDAEPSNLDDLVAYYQREIRRRPQDYGIDAAGGAKPAKWGEYVVGEDDVGIGGKGLNYGETVTQLAREGKYGRGVTEDLDNTPVEGRNAVQQAQVAALRGRMEDPLNQKAQEAYKYTTHFPSRNPLVYTRESTMGVPPGASTPGDMRFIEELQSDWGQFGRKKGIYDPEEARAAQEKRLPQAKAKFGPLLTEAMTLFERLEPEQQAYVATELGHANPDVVRQRVQQALEGDDIGEMMSLAQNLPNRVYWSATGDVENLASELLRRAENEAGRFESGKSNKLPPAPFIDDPKQWGKLGLQQAIIDAVRRGDQYVGWTPGYVHAPQRWGSEDLAWWTDEGQPTPEGQQMLPGMEPGGPSPKRKVAARGGSNYDYTRGEGFKQLVAALRKGETVDQYNAPQVMEIDPNSPDAQAQMEDIVRQHLSYEAGQYADSDQFIRDRAAKILGNMRKEAEGQYSPRQHGMHEFYDKQVPAIMERILKEAGSSGSGKGVQRFAEASSGVPMGYQLIDGEWKPIELKEKREAMGFKQKAEQYPHEFRYEPPRMHYVEIDPELARAAKRGFKLPF
jgi:hypothetical protein